MLAVQVVAQQVAVLLSNVASGIGVVFANKAVFTTAQFRFPVMLTAIHYAVNLVLLVILAAAGFVRWRTAASAERIHLVTAVWALHNGMSNLSLARNSVGLYQISKILVTPLICALERCLYNKVPPPRQAVALVGACAGVFLATVSDVQFTAVGAATALASRQTACRTMRGYSSAPPAVAADAGSHATRLRMRVWVGASVSLMRARCRRRFHFPRY